MLADLTPLVEFKALLMQHVVLTTKNGYNPIVQQQRGRVKFCANERTE
jgi:hypothetical protein